MDTQQHSRQAKTTQAQYHLTVKSSNRKTGSMPVSTTSSDTCPEACPLKVKGCYAHGGPLLLHWRLVSERKRGLSLEGFAQQIAALPEGTVWRHNQAGDLPGEGNTLDHEGLALLVAANRGRRGFTFTHKPVRTRKDRQAIAAANAAGFTINLSADTPAEADTLASLRIGPVVLTHPANQPIPKYTPGGRKLTVCPKQTHGITCDRCQLCAKWTRKAIILFLAHGSEAKYV